MSTEILVTEGLVHIIKSNNSDIKDIITSGFEEAQDKIQAQNPILVIFQLKKKLISVYHEFFKKIASNVNSIAICHSNDTHEFKQLLKSGIMGLTTIEEGSKALVNALEPVMDNGYYLSPMVLEAILCDYLSSEIGAKAVDWIEKPELTVREKEILGLMALGKKNSEIATQLYISIHTVDTHRKNILKKFKVKNSLEMIHKAVNYGLV